MKLAHQSTFSSCGVASHTAFFQHIRHFQIALHSVRCSLKHKREEILIFLSPWFPSICIWLILICLLLLLLCFDISSGLTPPDRACPSDERVKKLSIKSTVRVERGVISSADSGSVKIPQGDGNDVNEQETSQNRNFPSVYEQQDQQQATLRHQITSFFSTLLFMLPRRTTREE